MVNLDIRVPASYQGSYMKACIYPLRPCLLTSVPVRGARFFERCQQPLSCEVESSKVENLEACKLASNHQALLALPRLTLSAALSLVSCRELPIMAWVSRLSLLLQARCTWRNTAGNVSKPPVISLGRHLVFGWRRSHRGHSLRPAAQGSDCLFWPCLRL